MRRFLLLVLAVGITLFATLAATRAWSQQGVPPSGGFPFSVPDDGSHDVLENSATPTNVTVCNTGSSGDDEDFWVTTYDANGEIVAGPKKVGRGECATQGVPQGGTMTVTDNDPGTTARDGNGKAAKGEYFLH